MASKHHCQLLSWSFWFQSPAPGPWCQSVSPSCLPTPLLLTSSSCSIQSYILLSFGLSPHPGNANARWIFGCSWHQGKRGMLGWVSHDGYPDTFAEIFRDRGVCLDHCAPCDPRCDRWHSDFRLPATQSGGRYNRQKDPLDLWGMFQKQVAPPLTPIPVKDK